MSWASPMPNEISAVANRMNSFGLMLRTKPPWRRIRSVSEFGGRTRACPTTSIRKLLGPIRKVRVLPVPAPKAAGGAVHGIGVLWAVARPGSVIVSQRSSLVVLSAIVPLPKRKMPYGSSAEKSVSTVITPHSLKPWLVSSTKRPAVEPIVPSPMTRTEPLKSSENTWRWKSIRIRTSAWSANSSARPKALRIDAAGQRDEERLGLRDDRELLRAGDSGVAHRVSPRPGRERDRDEAGVELCSCSRSGSAARRRRRRRRVPTRCERRRRRRSHRCCGSRRSGCRPWG